jgi:Mg2+ and Co2+ transporter CorA
MVVITGIYGMNVKIPGQTGPHAFAFVTGVMLVCAIGILWYFRRKRWR